MAKVNVDKFNTKELDDMFRKMDRKTANKLANGNYSSKPKTTKKPKRK